jgi:hypothetical protein
MFIQTEPTPNPATLKFLPGRAVVPGATANFTTASDAAKRSPSGSSASPASPGSSSAPTSSR